jgi:hypothetical protein
MSGNKKFASISDLFAFLKSEKSYDIRVPINVDEIASLLNIKVEEVAMFDEPDFIGRISFDEGNPVVTINVLENTTNHADGSHWLMKLLIIASTRMMQNGSSLIRERPWTGAVHTGTRMSQKPIVSLHTC